MLALNPSLFPAFASISGGVKLGPGISDAKYPSWEADVGLVLGSLSIQVTSIRL